MTIEITHSGLELIFSGALLFLIGLVQGVFIPKFYNPRMALSAHLTAVQCGMALMTFGVIWSLLVLGAFWLATTQVALITSVYLIWLGISVSAVTGASKALPIAGAGFSGGRMAERMVTTLETFGVVLSVGSGFLVLVGLAGNF